MNNISQISQVLLVSYDPKDDKTYWLKTGSFSENPDKFMEDLFDLIDQMNVEIKKWRLAKMYYHFDNIENPPLKEEIDDLKNICLSLKK